MDLDAVKAAADRLLDAEVRGGEREVLITKVWEFDDAWVVSYNSREFIETGELGYSLPAIPIIVAKADGAPRFAATTSPIESQVEGMGTIRWMHFD